MKVTTAPFGELDGQPVIAYTLKNRQGFEVTCLNYGCIITRIMAPDADGRFENVVLGFDRMEDYIKHSPYFGAIVGRVAGRIKDGRFELAGEAFQLPQNEGTTHLHGGNKGFSWRIWNSKIIEKEGAVGVEFRYTSPDGEEGYPGRVDMTVVYWLTEDNVLTIAYEGVTDRPTLLNVTNHSYFNLSGDAKRDVLHHVLTMKSDRFLELDASLLPTGRMLDVAGTPFDFRAGRYLEDGVKSTHEQNRLVGHGYDHPFVLSDNRNREIVLTDEESGRKLIVETDEPGVVLYTSNQLKGDFKVWGKPVRPYLGVCLETQHLPDAVHHPEFPSIVLTPGEIYRSTTRYAFCTLK